MNSIEYIEIGVPYLKLYDILYDLIFLYDSVSKIIVLCGLHHMNYIFTMHKFKKTHNFEQSKTFRLLECLVFNASSSSISSIL